MMAKRGAFSRQPSRYKGECQKSKAERTRRDVSPANPSPAAQAADTPKPPKPNKPFKSDERKGKGKGKAIHKQGKPNLKAKAADPKPSDSDATTWSGSLDSDSNQASDEPLVNHPPGEEEALSGERKVRPPSLSPSRFSAVPTDVLYPSLGRRTERKSSKHPTPLYPTTWESVGFGLTLQQLAFELAQHDTTVGSFISVRLLGVTKILGQKSYCFVTHSWTLHRPQDHQKQPSPMGFKQKYSPQKLHFFTHLQTICGITGSA